MDLEVNQIEQQDVKQENFIYEEYLLYRCTRQYQFQISPNQQLIALQNSFQIIVINLKNKKIIKTLELAVKQSSLNRIRIIRFSNDSKYLFCGTYLGMLYVFRADRHYKLISNSNQHPIMYHVQFPQHLLEIIDIKFISYRRIFTCSQMQSIIISDFIRRQRLVEILLFPYLENIYQIEFDSINQFIITCSKDHSVKFFNLYDGQLCIDAQNVDDTEEFRIFLINNNEQMITRSYQVQSFWKKQEMLDCSNDCLKLWQIDHQNKQLILIDQFKLFEGIDHFFQVQNPQCFIGIGQQEIYMMNNYFEVLSQTIFQPDKQRLYVCGDSDQIQKLEYIVVFNFCDKSLMMKVLKKKII